jgi:DNA-binding transcriptional regulator YhcF (GntR family)
VDAESEGQQRPHDRVVAALSEDIRTGELTPGTKLPPQEELATRFRLPRNTVREALAVLRAQGLISKSRRGAPSVVLEPSFPVVPEHSGVLELLDHIVRATHETDVRIDTFSYTTETLNKAVENLESALSDRTAYPRSITVRALLPSPDWKLGLPRLVADPADERPSRRMHALARHFATGLKVSLNNLAVRGLVERVSIDVRCVPVTPDGKFYLLNGTDALEGKYLLTERKVDYTERDGSSVTLPTVDIKGVETPLFHYSTGDVHGAAKYEELRHFFDDRWKLAEPLPLLGF